MGWDISYHPVDVDFIHQRVIPFVTGERELDDLFGALVTGFIVRRRAKKWAFGAMDADERLADLQDERGDPAAFGLPGFDCDVQVWGRPYFICDETPREVSATLSVYQQAKTQDEVDAIARRTLGLLDAKLTEEERQLLGGKLSEIVVPEESDDDKELSDTEIVETAVWKLRIFRDAFDAYQRGASYTDPDGREHQPAALFQSDFPLAALEFASQFRPGWMARGYGWPTFLIQQVDVDLDDLFESAAPLFEPLGKLGVMIAESLESTLTENYMLGGYVPVDEIPILQQLLEDYGEKINAWAESENWGEGGAEIYLQGIRESLWEAANHGLGFVEATEVYSGPMGVMN